ncbi:excinuclease ABC subunit UvrA [Candidatus Saccharibacteria bacterium]|nr:excinuclease ABC subunit UvrA [Candidatus Saccharibacteria bacterium]
MLDIIKIKGARQHNLKNIDLEIPKNKFVVVTGVSGSGKSSLAFDTVYAEGQRRYVESLSAYARQFLGVMDKPDVDQIEGLSPSISIDQKSPSQNPRSTVGTITEVYDLLRLLFARVGHPHCPNCSREVTRLSHDEITEKIFESIKTHTAGSGPNKFTLLSPVIRQKKGEFKDLFKNLMSKGFTKARVDGREIELTEDFALIKTNKHDIEAIVDELSFLKKDLRNEVFAANIRSRVSTAVEQALNLSDGLVILKVSDKGQVTSNNGEEKEELFSEKFSCPHCNISLPELEPRMFSFNSPLGACETCNGIGTVYKVDPERILNKRLSINEGGILPFVKFFFHETWYTRTLKTVCREEEINMDAPLGTLPKDKLETLLNGTGKVYTVHGKNRYGKPTTIYERFDGVIGELERRYLKNEGPEATWEIKKYMREEECGTCQGARLKSEVLAVTIEEINIAEMSDFPIHDLLEYLNALPEKLNQYELEIAKSILKEVDTRLTFLDNVGLSYLTVSRSAKTLSGGELQRIRLASQIGTGLTGVLYVLDEPSVGLHPKDMGALITTLKRLKDLGNTLVIVEHDRDTMEAADHLIELGPRAGRDGGRVTFQGTVTQIKKKTESLTGQFLSNKRRIKIDKPHPETGKGTVILTGASQYNLKNIKVEVPLGNLVAVTGVSGSGKSTLVVETLYPALRDRLGLHVPERMGSFKTVSGYEDVGRVYLVDQSPIGRTPRSNPATYVGFFDDVRELFAQTPEAKTLGFKKGRFSFNVKGGRCEKCQGGGVIKIEMQFLADVYVTCDVCDGKRYNQETLEVKFKGKTIYDVLKMTVDEAAEFFRNHPKIYQKLKFLQDVGLGYFELGQGAPTFSGGEAQRIKLVNELSRRQTGDTLYILDEPTTGLHFADIEKLLTTLYRLVEGGNTVLIIEHNPEVVKNAQWIIDLGPEGGERGGQVVYQGPLEKITTAKNSHTGQYLKKYAKRV